jgi:hypothetical protein
VQVQQRQHLRDPRGFPSPRGQNRRAELLPLACCLIDTLVVDPRFPHRDRARRRRHLPLGMEAITDHQPPTVLVELVLELLEVGGDQRTFPNQRANPGPDQIPVATRSSSGRCAPSRSPADDHPQVLIIAPRHPSPCRGCLRRQSRSWTAKRHLLVGTLGLLAVHVTGADVSDRAVTLLRRLDRRQVPRLRPSWEVFRRLVGRCAAVVGGGRSIGPR